MVKVIKFIQSLVRLDYFNFCICQIKLFFSIQFDDPNWLKVKWLLLKGSKRGM